MQRERGFENGESVEIVPFDYDRVDSALNSTELDTTTVVRQFLERCSDALIEMIDWAVEPVDACTMSRPKQVWAKLSLILLNTRPNSLGLTKPTITELATLIQTPKQKLSQLNRDFRGRFGRITPAMKTDAVCEKLAARFTDGRHIKKTDTEQMLMEF